MAYEYNKKWRLLHTDKRNKERKKYYDQFSLNNTQARKRWTLMEMYLITHFSLNDREMHELLGRSVRAIQVMRCKLNENSN